LKQDLEKSINLAQSNERHNCLKSLLKMPEESPKKLQLEIDNEVKNIINEPEIGELKKGNLKAICVHKF
jgi:hypothetical protein